MLDLSFQNIVPTAKEKTPPDPCGSEDVFAFDATMIPSKMKKCKKNFSKTRKSCHKSRYPLQCGQRKEPADRGV
jgi:hypothetical protein